MSNPYADAHAALWYVHPVEIQGTERMTAYGPKQSPPVPVNASIRAEARTVTNARGQEVIAAATVKWHIDGPLPEPGDLIDLPAQFGLAPGREVVTARRALSGTDLTPDHVEVTVK